jgi:hypothetical protein
MCSTRVCERGLWLTGAAVRCACAGLEQDVRSLQESSGRIAAVEETEGAVQHVMLSYEWWGAAGLKSWLSGG